jgi:2-dehydro-3-deoxyphosphooctonate aldolase (KDO 8-P synthase)
MKEVFPWLNGLNGQVSNSAPLFFILGPCVIESEYHTLKMAELLKKISQKLNFRFVFKSSYDKANRTSLKNYRGSGIDDGLRILGKVRSEFDLPIITDVHESWQVEPAAAVADVLQIPAFLCRQTDLLIAAGQTDKVIHIKKGQFLTAESMEHAVKKVESAGNKNIWICERGYTFGYNNLVVDYRNFLIMKSLGKPVIFDATHAVQRPGGMGMASGGDRVFVPSLAAAAVVQCIAGLFLEVHDNPEAALSDGPNMVRLSELEGLLAYLIDLDAWAKQNPVPVIS